MLNNLLIKINATLNALFKKFLIPFNKIANTPHGRLIRLNSYYVYSMLFLPTWCVIAMNCTNHTFLEKFCIYLIFCMGAFITRSVGCIINDILDIEFDKQVERTKTRPLVTGEITINEALLVAGLFTTLGFLLLLFLPIKILYIAIFSLIMSFIYALSKRVIKVPQLVLGITFNLGVLMAWLTISNEHYIQMSLMYIGFVFLTFGYDTIYACQDIEDDTNANINSFPVFLKSEYIEIKPVVWNLYRLSSILFSISGLGMGMNFSFFLSLAVGSYFLYSQLQMCDIDKPSDCMIHFKKINLFLFILFLGTIFGK